jgi:hypothetical protein
LRSPEVRGRGWPADKNTTHRVITFGIPAIGQGRRPLQGCISPQGLLITAQEALMLTWATRNADGSRLSNP